MTSSAISLHKLQPSNELLAMIPARIALHYTVIPVELRGGVLRLAVPEDFSRQFRDELRIVLNREVAWVNASRAEIEEAIARLYGVGAGTVEVLTQDKNDDAKVLDFERVDHVASDSATVAKLVNELIVDAMKQRASDIHVEPFDHQFRIRYRVDGILREAKVPEQIRRLAPGIISRIKIMANLDIGEKRLPQDGRIKIKKNHDELDLRVSVLPSSYGEAIVIRILKPLELLALEDLGFETAALQQLRSFLKLPHGMILVTGPTGSGKTTTLYAALKELNSLERKIITVEDPIEYKLPGIIQMQVNTKIGFTFASALRSMLRHDPDCLMVGEIRDSETAEMAVRSALTGHLVFSTLHTNDAPSAVTRLLEMGIEGHLIASSLTAVVAQRLVRKVCPPCEKCSGSGFFGRTVIYEIMPLSERLRAAVSEKKPASVIRTITLEEGMLTLVEHGLGKARAGLTSEDEVLRATAV